MHHGTRRRTFLQVFHGPRPDRSFFFFSPLFATPRAIAASATAAATGCGLQDEVWRENVVPKLAVFLRRDLPCPSV